MEPNATHKVELTDEQWSSIREICEDIERYAALQDPIHWDDFLGEPGIKTRLAEVLEAR